MVIVIYNSPGASAPAISDDIPEGNILTKYNICVWKSGDLSAKKTYIHMPWSSKHKGQNENH